MNINRLKIYPVFFFVIVLGVFTSIYFNLVRYSNDFQNRDTGFAANASATPQSGQPASNLSADQSTQLLPIVRPSTRQVDSVDSTTTVKTPLTDEDFQKHIAALKKTLPDDSYSVVLQKPFVVIGNETPEFVRQRAERTVKWAVDRLKDQYFEKDPEKIIDIWLLKDKSTYENQCKRIVNYKPTTPYGFYSSTHNVLMMNISTGGGTLVHEIVHPFIEVNFPSCPSWFNEGLASLYEQSSSNANNNIIGLTNWRLRGLQLAIKDDKVPSFEILCSTTTQQFYREDPGTNYSQARYLCYYLQQKGKLQKFYKSFVANCETDQSGYRTLMKVLDTDDMAKFKQDWQRYVMELRFP